MIALLRRLATHILVLVDNFVYSIACYENWHRCFNAEIKSDEESAANMCVHRIR